MGFSCCHIYPDLLKMILSLCQKNGKKKQKLKLMHPYEVKGPPKVQPGSVFLDAIDKKCKSHTIFIKLYIVIYKETRYKYMYTQ